MPRRYEDEPSAAHAPVVDANSFGIHRNGNNLSAGCFEHHARSRITGIFNADAISRIQNDARYNVYCLLYAGDDENLFGRAFYTPPRVEIIGDRFAQRRITDRVATDKQIARSGA